jgi:hypothetical protein
MSAKIISFPGRKREATDHQVINLSLYSDEEIILSIIALNSFGFIPRKVTIANLVDQDPFHVISCIRQAKESHIFSDLSKQVFSNIIASFEVENHEHILSALRP